MSEPPLVLAVDIGTSSVRALLFDHRARSLPGLDSHRPYRPTVSADGTAEVNPVQLFRLTRAAIDEAMSKAGPQRRRVAAVGISTFWHGLMASDSAGEPLTPLYLWSDTRSWRQAELLRTEVDAEAVRQRTGCPIHSSYWPARLAWLKARRPDLWSRRPRWHSFGDLLFERLFGVFATSSSMASGTGLLALDDLTWDQDLLRHLGLSPDALPPLRVREAGLGSRDSRRWPELAGVPWIHAAGDGSLANLGSGCLDASQRALTVGTSGALRVMTPRAPTNLPAGLWRYLLDGRRQLVGGALSNGGNLYAWLAGTLRVAEPRLERELARMAPAAHGLSFLPLLAGERSPGYASQATGAVAGLTLATRPQDLVRAGLEAVALEFARVSARLDDALPRPRRLVASGAGLVVSPAWMQIMADVLGAPVAASRERESSSRGAAILALEGIGFPAAGEHPAPVRRTFEPNAAAADAYREALDRQEALYRVLIGEGLLRRQGAPAHLQTDG